jgi:nicotinate dehydrogenase subunit B
MTRRPAEPVPPRIQPAEPAAPAPRAEESIEVERYELTGPPAYVFALERRDFLRIAGGGLLVLAALPGATVRDAAAGQPARTEPPSPEIGAWLHIPEHGAVTVYTGKTEVGQNIRTSLTQAVAEELRVAPEAVSLVMADTARTPFDMGTFGSRTTPLMAPQLRRAAAVARELLIDLAAERWQVARGEITVASGRLSARSGQSAAFGELTKGRELVARIDERIALRPPEAWTALGRPLPKVDGRAMVTGRHLYTPDLTRPGMLAGKVLRPAGFNGVLVSLDTARAEQVEGVAVVRDGDFVGVVAPDQRTAERGLAALDAKWRVPPQPSAPELFAHLRKTAASPAGTGRADHEAGAVEEGLRAADRVLEQTYTLAYIAHVPLEPRAAVAEWSGDRLTVWTGTQRPFGVQQELATAFRVPLDRVRVIVPDTGSAYGGKHTGEAAVEAARLAKAAGRPVKLVWTREEEFTWAYFRPAGVIEVRSGVRADGALLAWEFHNYNSGTAAIRTLYEVANQRIAFHPAQSPLRQGSYRVLAATANHFARETHMDELAHALGMDPLAFRLRNLKDPRLRAVLEAAADRFGWNGRSAAAGGVGAGIACGFEKGSYVAACAAIEARRGSGEVAVTRLVTAFECGAIVNPDGLRSQVDGCIIQGLGGALFEAIDFADGRILTSRLRDYRVPRFSDVPPLETILIDRRDLPPAGAGETPIVGVAPAIGNAIFAATGVRLRSLPLVPHGLPIETDQGL